MKGRSALVVARAMMHPRFVGNQAPLYDDGRIALDDDGVILRWYYLWGTKKIPYKAIRSVKRFPIGKWRQGWRVWGSGDFKHWYNLDRTRPHKTIALELHGDTRTIPTITPDDPDTVERLIAERLAK
jgi:hypothetical protein